MIVIVTCRQAFIQWGVREASYPTKCTGIVTNYPGIHMWLGQSLNLALQLAMSQLCPRLSDLIYGIIAMSQNLVYYISIFGGYPVADPGVVPRVPGHHPKQW